MADPVADPKLPKEENEIPAGLSGGFFVCEAKGRREILFADRNVLALYACESMEEFRILTENRFSGMVHAEDRKDAEREIETRIVRGGHCHDDLRFRLITKNGDVRYAEAFMHLLHAEDGRAYLHGFLCDVSKETYLNFRNLSRTERVFRSQETYRDVLSGLPNRSAFFAYAREIAMADRDYENITVAVFDIVGLRRVNFHMSREEGDRRILSLIEIIQNHMPEKALVFRGHEAEIMVLFESMSEAEVLPYIQKVIDACNGTVSFGISSAGIHESILLSDNDCFNLPAALEEARYALKVKKLMVADSHRSQFLASLVSALKETDADTEDHVQRTQRNGAALGRRAGLSDTQITVLRLLCLLHDIGKIAVPLEILNKPGRLTDEEWSVLQTHPQKGSEIVKSSDELRPLADLILAHHERWDGRGYPLGIRGEEIPVLSRIISIVDAYDAMVNDRCYRKALSPAEAKKEIRDNAGSQFDPLLAETFLELLEEQPELALGAKTGSRQPLLFANLPEEESTNGNTSAVLYTEYTLDVNDTIIGIDSFFESMTGYSREEVIGKMTQDMLIPPEDLRQYRSEVSRQFAKGDISYLKHRILCKDGTIKNVICNGERYYDSSVMAYRATILVFEV